MRYTLVFMLLAISIAFSDTVTQTDWSGGAGVQGPVLDWSDTFYSTDGNLSVVDGMIKLAAQFITPVEHTVDGDFGAYSVYSADIDNDGDMDVLGAAMNANDITWWENTDGTGTSWTEHIVDEDFGGAISVYAVDIDDDGDTDVLGAGHYADDITWWENTDGTGTSWTEHTIDGSFDGAKSVYSADIDGDGDTDVLGAAQQADDITWGENTDGTGTSWTEHIVDGNFDVVVSVYSTDVDGDGDADVLGAAAIADDITWWENTDGTGTSWTEHTVDGNFDGAASVYSTDVDGDGDADVLGAATGVDDITWWENTDGTGTSWTEHTVDGDFDGAYSVYAADVNGDGAMDVLGAAVNADEITWWEVQGYTSVGTLESSILDLDYLPEWDDISFTSTEPAGTSIGFQVRSSDESDTMGAWSNPIYTSGTSLNGILSDSTQYIQYRVVLETTDPSYSAILEDVSLSFSESTVIEEMNATAIFSAELLPFSPNPVRGLVSASIAVPEADTVNLSVFDITGRMVRNSSGAIDAGYHSIELGELNQGIYFCRMVTEDYTSTQKFIVIE